MEYIYKKVDRLLYTPRDSKVLELELQNLEQMHDRKGIIQLIAVIMSNNPYQTTKAKEDNNPTSLQGILLEYYLNSTLQNVL